MNLCVDCGNTHIKWSLYDRWDKTNSGIIDNEHAADIGKTLENYDSLNVIVCSVRKHNYSLSETLKDKSDRFIELNSETPTPIKNLYRHPETLGADRLAAIVGANFLNPGKDNIVIDLGTAATFDIINRHKEYRGGNISAGLRMRLKALHEHTAKLPLAEIDESKDVSLFGCDTRQALSLGAVNGLCFEIIGYIASAFQNNDVSIFLTGGDAKLFEKRLKSDIFASILKENNFILEDIKVNEDLVSIGLNRIIEYNI